jgi:hypothetical protein
VRIRDYDDEDDARSVATIVPHELERVEEEGEEQIAKQEQQEQEQLLQGGAEDEGRTWSTSDA